MADIENQEITLTEHEQAMIDVVDSKAAVVEGHINPENAEDYVEPKDVNEEPDYKALYEASQLADMASREMSPEEPKGLEVGEDEPKAPEVPEVPEDSGLTPGQMNKFTNEYDTNGNLSEESYTELKALGLTKDVVDAYIQGQAAIKTASDNKVYESVGGKETYDSMISWAKENWTDAQKHAFNSQVNSGDSALVAFGVEALASQYKANQGSPIPGKTLKGNSSGTQVSQGYANSGEMYAAMRNPLYGKDPSYTKSVEKKVGMSHF